jgi:hypothetical protein
LTSRDTGRGRPPYDAPIRYITLIALSMASLDFHGPELA